MRMPDVVFYWSGQEFQLCTGPECHKSVTDVFLYTGNGWYQDRPSDESRVMSHVSVINLKKWRRMILNIIVLTWVVWDKPQVLFEENKVGCVLPMVIWPELRLGQDRDDDHWEDAPHFTGEIEIMPWSMRVINCSACCEFFPALFLTFDLKDWSSFLQ